jgi:hypothetical protein
MCLRPNWKKTWITRPGTDRATRFGILAIMKYVPSLPPPTIAPGDRWETPKLTAVRPTKAVQERSLSPLIFYRHPRREPVPAEEAGQPAEEAGQPAEEAERRHAQPVPQERRSYCRRVRQHPLLMELRTETDRRRHRQRKSDSTEHIDEEV